LEGFKACAAKRRKGLLLATMQGRFAEGADFPGKELEGIFIVGVPFDRMTMRTKLYLNYYKDLYGREKGNLYAYVIPALKRTSQALGRCLRSKQDRAVFVLGDRRYSSEGFLKILPDYIKGTATIGRCKDTPSLLT
jgi:DNA excision repair protein ERCC-2